MTASGESLTLICSGPRRDVAFFHGSDGRSQPKEFLEALAADPRLKGVRVTALAKLAHLSREESLASDYKEWDTGIMQLTVRNHRLMLAEIPVWRESEKRKVRTLVAFYMFGKRSKRTPREHENAARDIRKIIKEGIKYQ